MTRLRIYVKLDDGLIIPQLDITGLVCRVLSYYHEVNKRTTRDVDESYINDDGVCKCLQGQVANTPSPLISVSISTTVDVSPSPDAVH